MRQTGKKLWTHQYDCDYTVQYVAGPRASVTIDDGRAYALGTMGHLHCCDAADGKMLWAKDLNDEYKIRMPIWGIAASPLVEKDLVIVQIGGEPNACLVAFDKRSGEERWRALPDRASYSAPIMIEQAGKRVLVCWTGDNVVGLDPASGKRLLGASVQADADGDQHRHARRGERSAVRQLVLRRLADAQALPGPAGRRADLAAARTRRKADRQPALDHQHALPGRRLRLRRRQLRRAALPGRQDRGPHLGKSRRRCRRPAGPRFTWFEMARISGCSTTAASC